MPEAKNLILCALHNYPDAAILCDTNVMDRPIQFYVFSL